jgi:predicted ribonuclease YlaK
MIDPGAGPVHPEECSALSRARGQLPPAKAATTVVVLDTSALVADPGALHAFGGRAAKIDAVVALSDGRRKDAADEVLAQVTGEGRLTMESVTYLRGRSLPSSFVLLDEAQNLEPSLAKTLLTRAAEGAKVVFTGDTSQIDAPFLSAHNNAMAVVTAALGGAQGGALFGHIRLAQGERSPLASLAARVF